MMTKLNKITYHKLELKDVIENNSKFYKKNQDKKLRIKRIRIKVDIFINQRTILKISMGSVVSKIRREKSGRRRKKITGVDSSNQRHHASLQQQENDLLLLMTR